LERTANEFLLIEKREEAIKAVETHRPTNKKNNNKLEKRERWSIRKIPERAKKKRGGCSLL